MTRSPALPRPSRLYRAALAQPRFLLEPLEPRQLLSTTPSPLQSIATANNAFALDLYSQLRTTPGNLFYSPYSIDAALAMVLGGARGTTASEIANALHLPSQYITDQGMQALTQLLQANLATDGYDLSVANRLWGANNYAFDPDFLAQTQQIFGAGLQSLDFSNRFQSARTINDWVALQTHDKILNLISPDNLSAFTRLVLTDAIYFKGDWESPFQASQTRAANFYQSPTKTSTVSLMYQKQRFSYYEQSGAAPFQALEMNYAGGDLDMLVILPPAGGLDQLESTLTPALLDQITSHMTNTADVRTYLPQFKLEDEFSLTNTLQNLGITQAFQSDADFSGISPQALLQPLHISGVVHKSYIDVNATGTEAAAATGIAIGTTACISVPPPVVTFRADHPFLFAIREKSTGALLFMGRVTEPPPASDYPQSPAPSPTPPEPIGIIPIQLPIIPIQLPIIQPPLQIISPPSHTIPAPSPIVSSTLYFIPAPSSVTPAPVAATHARSFDLFNADSDDPLSLHTANGTHRKTFTHSKAFHASIPSSHASDHLVNIQLRVG